MPLWLSEHFVPCLSKLSTLSGGKDRSSLCLLYVWHFVFLVQRVVI